MTFRKLAISLALLLTIGVLLGIPFTDEAAPYVVRGFVIALIALGLLRWQGDRLARGLRGGG